MPVLAPSDELRLVKYQNGIKLVKPVASIVSHSMADSHTVQAIMRLPIAIYFDNLNHETLTCNDLSAEECGFDSSTRMRGRSWYQYFKLSTVSQPLAYVNETLQKEIVKISYENATRNDGSCRDVISIRMPWYDDDNVIKGLFGCAIILDLHPVSESFEVINQLGILNSTLTPQTQKLLGKEINSVHLSKRKCDCLYLTIRGKTAKQIAAELGLSCWTVQEYLANIKLKMNVSTKSQLIEKTIDSLYKKFHDTDLGS